MGNLSAKVDELEEVLVVLDGVLLRRRLGEQEQRRLNTAGEPLATTAPTSRPAELGRKGSENRDFVDATVMAELNPETFATPSAGALDWLGGGDLVKLTCGGERFWVDIVQAVHTRAGIAYRGVVDSDTAQPDLKRGDEVLFERRHVHEIRRAD